MKPEKKLGLPSLPSSAARPARSMSVTSEEAGSEASIPPGAYIKIENFEILSTLQFHFDDHPLFQPQHPLQSQARSVPSLSLVEVGEQCKGRDLTSHRWISNHSALQNHSPQCTFKWILNHNALFNGCSTSQHCQAITDSSFM